MTVTKASWPVGVAVVAAFVVQGCEEGSRRNVSPVSVLVTCSVAPSGDVTMTYDLHDVGGSLCSIEVEYRGGSARGTSLTGTPTFTNGDVNVTGSGTLFMAQVAAGDDIKLDADGVWARVASVTDDTNLVLSDPYADTGGSGPASVGPWVPATVAGATADLVPATGLTITWDSATDEAGEWASDYVVRMRANDGTVDGAWVQSDALEVDNSGALSPQLAVTYPNGAEALIVGSLATVTWDIVDSTKDVTIELSTDPSSISWITLVASTANDGSETVTLPYFPVTQTECAVRVREIDGQPSDESDSDFTIVEPPARGTLVWAKRAGEWAVCRGKAVSGLSSDNSTYVAGSFVDDVTFGAGEANETTLRSAGGDDIFLACYDAGGALEWAVRAGGTGNEEASRVAVPSDGSAVYVAGVFEGTVTFGSTTWSLTGMPTFTNGDVNVTGSGTLFTNQVAAADWIKLDTEGIWVQVASVTDDTNLVLSNAYPGTTGSAPGSVRRDATVTSAAAEDIFLARYNMNGAVAWVKRAGGTSADRPTGIAIYGDGSIILVGSYGAAGATFGPGEVPNPPLAGQTFLASVGGTDIFLAKYKEAGSLQWAVSAGGPLDDSASDVDVRTSDGTIYVTGWFSGTGAFGSTTTPLTGSVTFTNGSTVVTAMFTALTGAATFTNSSKIVTAASSALSKPIRVTNGSAIVTASHSALTGTPTFANLSQTVTAKYSALSRDIKVTNGSAIVTASYSALAKPIQVANASSTVTAKYSALTGATTFTNASTTVRAKSAPITGTDIILITSDTAVTATTADFTTDVAAGDYIKFDGDDDNWCEVESVTGPQNLVLFAPGYTGTGGTGTASVVKAADYTAFLSSGLVAGDYIRLDADGDAWGLVSGVDSETKVTLSVGYAGAGGSGAGSVVKAADYPAFLSSGLANGDYISLDADDDAWRMISSVNTDTRITLSTAYGGAGGSGAGSVIKAADYIAFTSTVTASDRIRLDADGDTWYAVLSVTDTRVTLTGNYTGTSTTGPGSVIRAADYTSFTTQLAPGDFIRLDSDGDAWYEILTRDSNTGVTLTGDYTGASASGAASVIKAADYIAFTIEVAADDYIRLDSDDDTWYAVASVTDTQVTLTGNYAGGSTTGPGSVIKAADYTAFSTELAPGEQIRLDSDGDIWYVIESVDSDTQITLAADYAGSGAPGPASVITVADYTSFQSEVAVGDEVVLQRDKDADEWRQVASVTSDTRLILSDPLGYGGLNGSGTGLVRKFVVSNGAQDMFLARYKDLGALEWVLSEGGILQDRGIGVGIHQSGAQLYVTGNFQGSMVFGPKPELPLSGTLTFTNGDRDVSGTGGTDFLNEIAPGDEIMLDPDGVWVEVFDVTGSDTLVLASPYASAGGSGAGSVKNYITLASDGQGDVFVARYNRGTGVLAWAGRAGGPFQDTAVDTAAHPSGNAILTGTFGGTATFGASSLTSDGAEDVFLASYGVTGSLEWAKRAGGTSVDEVNDLWLSAVVSDLTLRLAGSFNDSATLGPGEANETTLPASGKRDVFVSKHAANGALTWARHTGSSSPDRASDIAALLDGSTFVAGRFENTVAFGQGETPNVDPPRGGETKLGSSGSSDVFLARYDSAGLLVWATQAGGTSADEALAVAALPDGTTAIVGTFGGSATFEPVTPSPLTGTLTLTNGSVGVSGFGTSFTTEVAVGDEIRLDADDVWVQVASIADDLNLVLSDMYSGAGGSGAGSVRKYLTSAGMTDIFVARYAPDGSLEWATRAGGSWDDVPHDVAFLADGSVLVTGTFNATATFGAMEANQTILSDPRSRHDMFLACYNLDGTLRWATSAGADSAADADDCGYCVATLADGTIYVAGAFQGDATFGAGEANETVLASDGADDVFLARYESTGALSWAVRAGGTSGDTALGVAVPDDGSAVYVTGVFAGTSTFGPGIPSSLTGGLILTTDEVNVSGWGTSFTTEVAVSDEISLDAEDVWVEVASVTNDTNLVLSEAYPGVGVRDVGGEPASVRSYVSLTSDGLQDVFLSRYDSDGRLVWVVRSGGTADDVVGGVAVRPDGQVVYVTGVFGGTATFGRGDANETDLASVGADDIFLARYATNGSLDWANPAGGSREDYCGAVALQGGTAVYVAGSFMEEATFGPRTPLLTGTLTFTTGSKNVPGLGTLFTTQVATGDSIRLDADGVWVRVASVTSDTSLVLASKYPAAGGTGPGSVGTRLTSPDYSDVFVARYEP